MSKLATPNQHAISSINNLVGLKLLTHLTVSLSHLNKHRFNRNFQNSINPLCSCSLEIKSTSHFLLHCYHYTNICLTLLNSIAAIIGSLISQMNFFFFNWDSLHARLNSNYTRHWVTRKETHKDYGTQEIRLERTYI